MLSVILSHRFRPIWVKQCTISNQCISEVLSEIEWSHHISTSDFDFKVKLNIFGILWSNKQTFLHGKKYTIFRVNNRHIGQNKIDEYHMCSGSRYAKDVSHKSSLKSLSAGRVRLTLSASRQRSEHRWQWRSSRHLESWWSHVTGSMSTHIPNGVALPCLKCNLYAPYT